MTTVRWVLLLLIAAAIFASPESRAGDRYSDNGYRRNHHRATCVTDFWGRCVHVARNRHAYRWRYYRHRRHGWHVPGAAERIDPGLHCHARRRVVGEDAAAPLGTGKLGNRKIWVGPAERKATLAWMGSVRYDHGERYQDLDNAKDVRQICSFAGFGGTTGTRRFYRCVLEATPCRTLNADVVDTSERRIETEEDERK